jgi:hypothetical protein
MMKVTSYEVNSEYLPQYLSWGRQLMAPRNNEAVQSLKKENIERESSFLLEINGKQFLLFVTISKDAPKEADMNMPVNKEHREMNSKTLKIDTRTEAKIIYDTIAADSYKDDFASS